MLLKLVLSKIQNVKVGAQAPEKKVRVPGTMRHPWIFSGKNVCLVQIGEVFDNFFETGEFDVIYQSKVAS